MFNATCLIKTDIDTVNKCIKKLVKERLGIELYYRSELD